MAISPQRTLLAFILTIKLLNRNLLLIFPSIGRVDPGTAELEPGQTNWPVIRPDPVASDPVAGYPTRMNSHSSFTYNIVARCFLWRKHKLLTVGFELWIVCMLHAHKVGPLPAYHNSINHSIDLSCITKKIVTRWVQAKLLQVCPNCRQRQATCVKRLLSLMS